MMNSAVKRNPVITYTVRLNKPSFFKRIGAFIAGLLKTRQSTSYNLPTAMDARLYL